MTWYAMIETKQLEQLHSKLYRAVTAAYDVLADNSIKPPEWLEAAARDAQEIYADLWARREAGSPFPAQEADYPD